jgi:hypothetical protein
VLAKPWGAQLVAKLVNGGGMPVEQKTREFPDDRRHCLVVRFRHLWRSWSY